MRKRSARAARRGRTKAVGPSAAEACETASRQRRAGSLCLGFTPTSARLKEKDHAYGRWQFERSPRNLWRFSYWWRPTASSLPPNFLWSRCAAAAWRNWSPKDGGTPRRSPRATAQLDANLAACQLGITISSLGLGWIGEPALAHLIEPLLSGVSGGSRLRAHMLLPSSSPSSSSPRSTSCSAN